MYSYRKMLGNLEREMLSPEDYPHFLIIWWLEMRETKNDHQQEIWTTLQEKLKPSSISGSKLQTSVQNIPTVRPTIEEENLINYFMTKNKNLWPAHPFQSGNV